jgi:hypothetical protein|tara:strand:+ start:116 stop:325 length:210 start_codon:yes stop_codon:yes gene_type:complete
VVVELEVEQIPIHHNVLVYQEDLVVEVLMVNQVVLETLVDLQFQKVIMEVVDHVQVLLMEVVVEVVQLL